LKRKLQQSETFVSSTADAAKSRGSKRINAVMVLIRNRCGCDIVYLEPADFRQSEGRETRRSRRGEKQGADEEVGFGWLTLLMTEVPSSGCILQLYVCTSKR
jgi:hypothetical protein